MSQAPYFVGLDVGGTSIKAGVVDDAGVPLSSVDLTTEAWRGQEFGLARMAEAARLAVREAGLQFSQIAAIGAATPGTMDLPAGIILDPPNLKPWQNVPVRKYLEETYGLPTAFQNDANAAAFGEYWVGTGRGVDSIVLFTLGTGIGGGIVIGGRIHEGQHSHGAEVGHIRIALDNARMCGCGRRGCLEAYASATSVVARTEEALAVDSGRSTLHKLTASGQTLSARAVFEAGAAGDALAESIVAETAFFLAVGATSLMHVIDPDMVIFGGGMTAAGPPFLERIRRHVRELAFPIPAERTQILLAVLGSDAGFIGAAGCARQLYLRVGNGPK